ERMPLDISLDASYFKDNKIVLAGRDARPVIDAALFLTALRAACEEQDPYFSLDADNGGMWNKEGDEAFELLWERIKKDFEPHLSLSRGDKPDASLEVRTVSARRDYLEIWNEIAPRYSNLRSKLVFHPG